MIRIVSVKQWTFLRISSTTLKVYGLYLSFLLLGYLLSILFFSNQLFLSSSKQLTKGSQDPYYSKDCEKTSASNSGINLIVDNLKKPTSLRLYTIKNTCCF